VINNLGFSEYSETDEDVGFKDLPPTGKQIEVKTMDEQTRLYLWMGVFFIGLVVFFMGVFRKQSPIKINPVLGAVVGICLILPGFIWGIFPTIGSPASPIQTQPNIIVNTPDTTQDTIAPPTFSVDPTAVTAASGMYGAAALTPISTNAFSQDENSFIIPVTVNEGTSYYAFANNYSAMNFSITPIAPAGADATDLATIYFESQYNMKYNDEYVLDYNAAETIWDALWVVETFNSATHKSWDHSGSYTTLYTTAYTLSLLFELNGANSELPDQFHTVGDTVSWTVTLHNSDWSWSKTVTVNAITIAAA
jgi:hypothetical protein